MGRRRVGDGQISSYPFIGVYRVPLISPCILMTRREQEAASSLGNKGKEALKRIEVAKQKRSRFGAARLRETKQMVGVATLHTNGSIHDEGTC